jgi:hypothetical protein
MAKAQLVAVTQGPDRQFNPANPRKVVPVHFNPESLKVAYANENRGGNQPSGGGAQYVGNQSSTLTVELLFDTTEPRGSGDQAGSQDPDVRLITKEVAHFIRPGECGPPQGNNSTNRVPPMMSFEWGTFIFRGTVESMDETLDYFSEEGVPMRATINLTIKSQDICFDFGAPGQADSALAPSSEAPPGSRPLQQANAGDSMQKMAGSDGRSGDWKAIAAANNIDDPLRLQAGALVNMNAGASVGFSAGAGVSARASAGASFGASAGAGVSFGASAGAGASFGASVAGGIGGGGQVGFSAGLGGGVGFSAGGGVGASAGFGASAGASAGFGASAGASAGFGASAGASAGFGASAGASAGLGASAGASAGFGASASAGAGASAGANLIEL